MKKKIKWIVIIAFVTAVNFVSITADAQTDKNLLNSCFYVTVTNNGTEVRQAIPCDFPVYLDTGNPKIDNDSFLAAESQWHSENPLLSNTNISAPSAPLGNFIEMDQNMFDSFPIEKQNRIQAIPYYYRVIQN